MTRIHEIATTETDFDNVEYVPGERADGTDVKIPQSLFASGGASGTSNPGSPTSGDRFFRTDLGFEIYYDGTRWLTVQQYTQDVRNSDQTLPISATSFYRAPFPFTGLYGIYVEHAAISSFPTATTAANYFVCQFSAINGTTPTNLGTTISTQNDTINSWTGKTVSAGVVISSAHDYFQMTATETGTASSYILGSVVYRLIIT